MTATAVLQVKAGHGTREALLDAVDALIAERGLSACSLQAVARRAGLTTGAVYSAFGSRGALLVAAMLRRTQDLAGLDPAERDLAGAVSRYARDYFAATEDEAGRNLLAAQLDLLKVGASQPTVLEALSEGYGDYVATLAAQLTERSAFDDPVVVARRMTGVLQGLALQRVLLGADIAVEEFVAAARVAVGA